MKKKTTPERWLQPYKGITLAQSATRPSSLKMLQYPSRMGSKLYYPNGEVCDVYKRPD
jgi:hypothetical protein